LLIDKNWKQGKKKGEKKNFPNNNLPLPSVTGSVEKGGKGRRSEKKRPLAQLCHQ